MALQIFFLAFWKQLINVFSAQMFVINNEIHLHKLSRKTVSGRINLQAAML